MMKKYEEIVSWVRDRIDQGELCYGDRLPSEKEMTETFAVSRQTVRRALEVLSEEGTVEGRRGSGTYVAVKKRQRSSQIRIAVMLTYVDTYIFPSIIKGIERVLSEEGAVLQICVTDNAVEKERMILQDFLRTRAVDGLIAEPVKSGLPSPNLELYKEIEKAGIPVLFINSFYSGLDIPHISLDDQEAGYLAAKHLLECGHTRIGGIFKSDDGQGHRRYAGYTKALMEREIKIKGSRVIWMDSEEIRQMGLESPRVLERLKDCTACVCYNDEIAYKLVRMLGKAGIRVPDEMSVTGIDNSSLAELGAVPLTSVKNPAEELGRGAAVKMLDRLLKERPLGTEELEPELVIRNSVCVISQI